MPVLEDIRRFLEGICEEKSDLKTIEEHVYYLNTLQKKAQIILAALDTTTQPSEKSLDLMSDTMSLLSMDVHSLSSEQSAHSNQLDIAILHASPFLIRLPDMRYLPLPQLNIKQEQIRLQRIFNDANRALTTLYGVMSIDTLRMVLDRNATVLHFSGHGGLSSRQDVLIFEDCNATGIGHLIDVKTLRSILCSGLPTTSLKLVFVSCCYSRQVGEVFLQAGVRHVVCLKQEEKVLDEASIIFANAFYHALLHGKPVPQAFAIAQSRVRAEAGQLKAESDKFVLLQNCDCSPSPERAPDCTCVFEPLFSDVPQGKFFNLQLHNASKKFVLPSLPPIVLGREMELHTLASLIHGPGGIVTLKGAPGIGKSTVALKLAHFIQERHVFDDGVIFCSVRGLTTMESIESSIRSIILAEEKMTVNAPLHTLLHHSLLILDHIEDAVDTSLPALQTFVHQLLARTPRLKLLVTSNQALEVPDEKIVQLNRLPPVLAAKLFVKKAPRACRPSDFAEEVTQPIEVVLSKHPLLAYLDGHPQAISLCASLLHDKTLPELTQAICTQAAALPPLMTSLQVAISSLSDPETLRFFALQGFLPAGALASDFRVLFGRDWERHANILCKYSLLQKHHHFPIKCKPRQKDVHHEALLSAIQNYGEFVSGTTRQSKIKMERSRSTTEESLQRTLSHAHLQSLSLLFSTFPFITSHARQWVTTTDAIKWTSHLSKSMQWTYKYIGTFSPFSNAAYMILDIHEANVWMCIEHYENLIDENKKISDVDDSDSQNQNTAPEEACSGDKNPSTRKKPKRQPKYAAAIASVICSFAHTLFLAGRHQGACRAAKLGLEISKDNGLKLMQAHFTKLSATLLVEEKQFDEARSLFGTALLLYRASDHQTGQAASLSGIGMIHSRQGNLRDAHTSFTKALSLYEWSSHILGQLNCHQRLGHLEKKLKLGDEMEMTQHYAACRRLQGDLNNKKEDELVRWVGHEMSLLLEVPIDSSKKKVKLEFIHLVDDAADDSSSFARRKSYDITRRRPSLGKTLNNM